MNSDPLHMWVIYSGPEDFPNQTVARLWHVMQREIPTDRIIIDTLDNLRERFKSMGLVPMSRDPMDVQSIVESWV